jgi:hypothetical protein
MAPERFARKAEDHPPTPGNDVEGGTLVPPRTQTASGIVIALLTCPGTVKYTTLQRRRAKTSWRRNGNA